VYLSPDVRSATGRRSAVLGSPVTRTPYSACWASAYVTTIWPVGSIWTLALSRLAVGVNSARPRRAEVVE
jgi:hypothetical protein